MPGLAIGDVVQVNLRSDLIDQRTINTYHYRCTQVGAGSVSVSADVDAVLERVENVASSLYLTWKQAIPSANGIQPIMGQVIKPFRSVQRIRVPANVVPGRGNTKTANLSAVITRGTDSGERGQTGSVHLPGVAEEDIVLGELVAGLLTAMQTHAIAMLGPITTLITGVVVEPVLYHPDLYDAGGILIRPWFTTPLTRYVIQEQVRVMRRRTVGLGI